MNWLPLANATAERDQLRDLISFPSGAPRRAIDGASLACSQIQTTLALLYPLSTSDHQRRPCPSPSAYVPGLQSNTSLTPLRRTGPGSSTSTSSRGNKRGEIGPFRYVLEGTRPTLHVSSLRLNRFCFRMRVELYRWVPCPGIFDLC